MISGWLRDMKHVEGREKGSNAAGTAQQKACKERDAYP